MILASNTPLRITSFNDRPAISHVNHALGVGGSQGLVIQLMRRISHEFRVFNHEVLNRSHRRHSPGERRVRRTGSVAGTGGQS